MRTLASFVPVLVIVAQFLLLAITLNRTGFHYSKANLILVVRPLDLQVAYLISQLLVVFLTTSALSVLIQLVIRLIPVSKLKKNYYINY